MSEEDSLLTLDLGLLLIFSSFVHLFEIMLLWAYHSLRGFHLQFNLSGRVIMFQLYCKTFAPITTNP